MPTWATSQQLVRVLPQGRGGAPAPAATSPTPQPSAQPTATPSVSRRRPRRRFQPWRLRAVGTDTISGRTNPGAGALTAAQTFTNQTVRMVLRTSIGGRRARVKLAERLQRHTGRDRRGAHRDPRQGLGDRRRLGSRADLQRSAVGQDGAWHGCRQRPRRPDDRAAHRPRRQPLLSRRHRHADVRTRRDCGRRMSRARRLRRKPDHPRCDHADVGTTGSPAVEVDAPAGTPLIVAFGDSITDGARSTPDTHNTWPAILATRLAADKATAHMAIVNQGIGGNRVLSDGAGLRRRQRAGASRSRRAESAWHPVADDARGRERHRQCDGADGQAPVRSRPKNLIWGFQQVADRAHQRGIKVDRAARSFPYEGAAYFREEGETIRQRVNEWIRTSGVYDAVVDFDAATRDPSNPRRLRPEFDPGDHLHPNDAGYQGDGRGCRFEDFQLRRQKRQRAGSRSSGSGDSR